MREWINKDQAIVALLCIQVELLEIPRESCSLMTVLTSIFSKSLENLLSHLIMGMKKEESLTCLYLMLLDKHSTYLCLCSQAEDVFTLLDLMPSKDHCLRH